LVSRVFPSRSCTGGRQSYLFCIRVNYTTLGYGDVIPVERWRLLGPIAAMNGVLLFGWSTAVIFEVLQKTLERIPSKTNLQDR
jgi:Ion channel